MAQQTLEFIRRTTVHDYKDILSIITEVGVEDGDYLPDHFHLLLKNPSYDSLVYILNGQIVGFNGMFTINNGTTGAMSSGRIRKDYQKRGILRKLGEEMLNIHHEIKRSVALTAANVDLIKQLISNGVYNLLTVRTSRFYSTKKKYIVDLVNQEINLTATKEMTVNDLTEMIRNKHLYKNVFCDGVLVVHGVPYDIMESNSPLMLKPKTRAIVSGQNPETPTLLTFGIFFRQMNGELFCQMDIYGNISDVLSAHVLRHVRTFFDIIEDNLTFKVRYKEPNKAIDKIMSKCSFEACDMTTRQSETYAVDMTPSVTPKKNKL